MRSATSKRPTFIKFGAVVCRQGHDAQGNLVKKIFKKCKEKFMHNFLLWSNEIQSGFHCVSRRCLFVDISLIEGLHYCRPVLFEYMVLSAVIFSLHGSLFGFHPEERLPRSPSTIKQNIIFFSIQIHICNDFCRKISKPSKNALSSLSAPVSQSSPNLHNLSMPGISTVTALESLVFLQTNGKVINQIYLIVRFIRMRLIKLSRVSDF